jgi:long-chain acyl-CoA synthetase
MSNLWDLSSHIQPATRRAARRHHSRHVLERRAAARGDKVWMRQKGAGHLAQLDLEQTGDAVREIAGGLMSLGFSPATPRPSCPTPWSNGCWPTWPC